MNKLTELFFKFPGVGPRQAKRFAYFLASSNANFVAKLARTIVETNKNSAQCSSCFKMSANVRHSVAHICEICADKNRDRSTLLIVCKDTDLENFEKSRVYNGKYFVIGGVIPLTEIKPTENMKIKAQ